jgi:hypothetical protein
VAPEARATHWRVDPSGTADFTTIQAALDAGGRDTVLVEPGVYPETLQYNAATAPVVLFGLGGPAATRIQTIDADGAIDSHSIRGLTVSDDLNLDPSNAFDFAGCTFDGRVYSRADDGHPNFADCDFNERTAFIQYSAGGGFEDLRFQSAPLYVGPSGTGPNTLRRCTFKGPADTLVIAAAAGGENGVFFSDCHFDSAGYGVVYLPGVTSTSNGVLRCAFQDLDEAAIYFDDTASPPCDRYCAPLILSAYDSRFERCGRGIVWLTSVPGSVYMSADTLRSMRGDAITITPIINPSGPSIANLVLEGGSGHGLVVDVPPQYAYVRSLTAR